MKFNRFTDESETDANPQSNYKIKHKLKVSKDILSKEQQIEKKQQILQQIDEMTFRVTTFDVSFEIDVQKVANNKDRLFENYSFIEDRSLDEKTVLILITESKVDQKIVFIFEMGAIVFWGFNEQQETHLNEIIENMADEYKFSNIFANKKKPLEKPLPDLMFFTNEQNDQGKLIDNNDTIHLQSYDLSEKLAFSYAMAQSQKLYVYEIAVDEIIDYTKDIPRELADSGTIKLSQKEISRLQGQLFEQRSDINLNSNLLDFPEYFWNQNQYEKSYIYSRKWYKIPSRIKILNGRLDIIKELYDMLNDELHHQHENHLEWIIIWILVIEVAIELIWNILIKDILGFFNSYQN